MRRITILFAFSVLLSFPGRGQSAEVTYLIDTTIFIMQANAVNASRVDWTVVRKNALEQARTKSDPGQLGPVMQYLFKSIDDFHGAFFYKDSMFQWQKSRPAVSDSIMNEWRKGATVRTRMLDKHIGYLRIPSMSGGSIEEFSAKAQALNDSLCKLLDNNLTGMIVDLRLNGGGAMHPMILGVQNLLPPGKVGEFHTKRKEDWILRDNSFIVDTMELGRIVPKCMVQAQNIPVVILTSPQTGSSGEFLIMAFKGRPKTILLGTTTAGYVTINNGYPINDTTFMNLSVGYGADKSGRLYTEAIKPDIFLDAPDSFYHLEGDAKVLAAIKWLKRKQK